MLIRYYGHVGHPSGYGDAANEFCMALLQVVGPGGRLEISTTGKELHVDYLPLAGCLPPESALTPDPDVVIVHTLPLDCAKVLEIAGIRESFPRARCIAYTTWEGLPPAPKVITDALAVFDEVWVPSAPTARALLDPGRVPVRVVPHCFDERALPMSRSGVTGNVPFTFYFVGAWTRHKFAEGVVHAFMRAFTAHNRVQLRLQCAGAPPDVCRIAMLASGLAPGDHAPIIFRTERVHPREIQAMHASGDVFVTASRGESWCLPAFDALRAGRHIIAPAGLGSDEFLLETSAYRYASHAAPGGGDVTLTGITSDGMGRARYVGVAGLTVRERWQDPDLDELANAMQIAYLSRRNTIEVRYDLAARFGRAAVATTIRQLLEAP